MKIKEYNIINTIKYGFLSVGLIIGSFLNYEKDIFFAGLIFLIGSLFLYFAIKSFKKVNNNIDANADVEQLYAPPIGASESQKITFYKRYLYLTLISIPLLSFFVIDDINNFENGSAEYLNLWWPVAILYKNFGYWAGILSVPILGVILVIAFLVLIKKVKWEHNKNNSVLIKRY